MTNTVVILPWVRIMYRIAFSSACRADWFQQISQTRDGSIGGLGIGRITSGEGDIRSRIEVTWHFDLGHTNFLDLLEAALDFIIVNSTREISDSCVKEGCEGRS